MYKQKISITINSEFDREKLYDEFDILIGNLCKTGQIIGGVETSYFTNTELISFQTTIEKTSLSKRYFDEYVVQRIKNLEGFCNSKLKMEVVGKAIPEYKGACKCKQSDFFILFTHSFNDTGSIDCGTCEKIVPLYKLKELTYDDRYMILKWERDYKSCDSLQLGCKVGEKWATIQMSDPKSQLSKSGLEICNRINEITGIPTYYYLHNYRPISHEKDKRRQCPSCHGKWLLKEQLLDFYDFKCDKCKLISTFSPITR